MESKIPVEARIPLIKKRLMGWRWTELSRWLKEEYVISIDRTNIARWYVAEANPDSVSSQEALDKDTVKDRVALDKRLLEARSQATFYKKLYTQSIQKDFKANFLVDAIHAATVPLPKVSNVKIKKPSGKRRAESSQIVVAPLTDTHIGEDVDYHQMGGLNAYSFEIFNKRLFGWASTLLNLVELRRASVPIDELVIPMLGDMISGDIHHELVTTNQDHVMGQMSRGANLIAQALLYLAPHFKTITVPCVVGNHGRMTRKPPMKDKYMDWDYMLYQWVASFCSEQKNIKFDIKTGYYNMFSVFDKNILIMHGDSASGAGSITSITNVLTKLRSVLQFRKGLESEVAAATETPISDNLLATNFDSAMIGHFHRVDELDIGTGHVIICGCMKGGDEFALQRLGVITKPQHIVTYHHPKYGYIGKETIYLNTFDNTPSPFEDVLTDVWSENPKFSV